MANETVLFAEDFAQLPIGVIGGDYSPAGEYHVSPILSSTGRWRETFIHYSYRSSTGNWQVVLERDGKKALEQTCEPKQGYPTLAAGDPYWREVTVSVALRPMNEYGWRAVIFRYRHARRFYAAVFAEGRLRVVRRDNDTETVLGEGPCTLDPDGYATVKIVCRGTSIRAEVDGREVVSCADDSPEAFLEGAIAFAATDVTRFRDVRVTAPPREAAAAAKRARLMNRPPPKAIRARLWKKIPTPDWGADRNLRVGDLDGDGRPELVLAQGTPRRAGDNFYSITSLAAYDLDGRQLWTIGAPNATHMQHTADLCFQVHDLDGDGKAEVCFCRDFEFCVAEGATGRIIRKMPMPRRLAHPQRPPGLHRHFGDSILFCDLTGSGRPDSIIIKDRYKSVFAFDRELRPLWEFFGNLGHYPFARDVDGDGRDEILIGYHLLDHDGAVKWNFQTHDHADNVAIVDLHDGGLPSGPEAPRVLLAASDAGFFILDKEGRQLSHYPIGHAQGLCVANLRPERPGLEIAVNTFWGAAGIVAFFDEAGRLLLDCEPMPYACLLQPVNWVPLDRGAQAADLILLSAHPRQGGLLDGHGRRAVLFPRDNHPTLCSDARDLDGDGVDEVLAWDHERLWIYKADVPGRGPENYPRRNPWYNDSNYRAQVSLPRRREG